jgi:hypothetical protein
MTANEQDWLAERFEANRPQLRAVAYPHRCRGLISSPNTPSAHRGKAGRPRATTFVGTSVTNKQVTPQIYERDRTLTTAPDHR